MSLNQSLRTGSYFTSCPATSTGTTSGSSASVSAPRDSGDLSGTSARDGSKLLVGPEVCQVGSTPHCVMYGTTRSGSPPRMLVLGQQTTPSCSPAPDEYHGRSQ